MSEHDIPALDSIHNNDETMGMDMMQRGESENEDEDESETESY